jgi:phosphate transport system substrate-binding protein
MNKLSAAVLLLGSILILSCQSNNQGGSAEKSGNLTIAGSTSVMPFVEKLAEHFMVDHPANSVDVQGGGSTAGIQACMNGTVAIGMSSRNLKAEETVLKETIICYDGIALIVHPSNPINGLTMDQVRDIFAGRIRNWGAVGGINRKIDAITREEGSGTRGSFEELVMRKDEISDAIMVQDSNGSVKAVIATDPYAIGYISMGLVDGKVKALTVDGVIPGIKAIRAKKYRIVRPFIFVTKGEPGREAKTFIDFILGKDGQNTLRKEGLVGAND